VAHDAQAEDAGGGVRAAAEGRNEEGCARGVVQEVQDEDGEGDRRREQGAGDAVGQRVGGGEWGGDSGESVGGGADDDAAADLRGSGVLAVKGVGADQAVAEISGGEAPPKRPTSGESRLMPNLA